MLLGSKSHTVGDSKRWRLDYSKWLENPAKIVSATVTSSSATCTVDESSVLGDEVIFFLNGGTQGEQVTVSIAMTDSDSNLKHDTIAFTVIAP
jgi:hypothetical protein